MKVTEQVAALAEPIVQAQGCSLWDVEYVREGSEYFLRLYIDKEGGVDIDDCEAVSRAVDPILDEKDPIPGSYQFEVCSAGLERALKRPSDFQQFMNSPVTVKLYRPHNGLKEIPGILVADPASKARFSSDHSGMVPPAGGAKEYVAQKYKNNPFFRG